MLSVFFPLSFVILSVPLPLSLCLFCLHLSLQFLSSSIYLSPSLHLPLSPSLSIWLRSHLPPSLLLLPLGPRSPRPSPRARAPLTGEGTRGAEQGEPGQRAEQGPHAAGWRSAAPCLPAPALPALPGIAPARPGGNARSPRQDSWAAPGFLARASPPPPETPRAEGRRARLGASPGRGRALSPHASPGPERRRVGDTAGGPVIRYEPISQTGGLQFREKCHPHLWHGI